MQNIPDVWVGAISAIAGGALVGCFALIAKLLEIRDKRISGDRSIMREKLGELYAAAATLEHQLIKIAIQSKNEGISSFNDPDEVVSDIERILRKEIAPLIVIYAPTTLTTFFHLLQTASNYCCGLVGLWPEDEFFELVGPYSQDMADFQEELRLLIQSEGVATRIRGRRFGQILAAFKSGSLVVRNSIRRENERNGSDDNL